MKRLICKLFGHKYKYNFPKIPTKCECKRCGKKWHTVKNPNYNYKNIFKEPIFIWEEILIKKHSKW